MKNKNFGQFLKERNWFIALFDCLHGESRMSQVVAGSLGIAGPFLVGAMTGDVQIGMVASLGGLALSTEGKGQTIREQVKSLIYALLAGCMAVFIGTTITKIGIITPIIVSMLALVITVFGGISRAMARAATLFLIFLFIAMTIEVQSAKTLGITFIFLGGAIWTGALLLISQLLFQNGVPKSSSEIALPPKYSTKQYLKRWWNSLSQLSGWSYPIRITSCLAAGQIYEWIWPYHHGNWVLVTIAIVVQRDFQKAFIRTFERSVGTVVGVVLAGLLLIVQPSAWIMIGIIFVLATIRTLLREVNYTAYTVIMTPLVIILLDFGKEPSLWIIIDRLIATLYGSILSLTLGYLVWVKLFYNEHKGYKNKESLH